MDSAGDRGPEPTGDGRRQVRESPLRRWLRAVAAMNPRRLKLRLDEAEGRLAARESAARAHEERYDALEAFLDQRCGRIEGRLDALEELGRRLDAIETTLRDLQATDGTAATARTALESRTDDTERALAALTTETARIRDSVLPAVADRSDLLLERLHGELEEVASLTERLVLREPLPAPRASDREAALARDLGPIHAALVDSLRGSQEEIQHRLAADLDRLRGRAPVLDLGCGRGELLVLLREAGIQARGVDGDPALVQGARRRGLEVSQGDVLDTVEGLEPGEFGAVTAYHLLEHLEPGEIARLLAGVRRLLRPGGVFLVESPNPHSLRVGASLFWLDPTHRRPLLPETLEVLARTAGFEVVERGGRHPFAEDQRFGGGGEPVEAGGRLAAMERRLDELLNGDRDFFMVFQRPQETAG